MRPSHSLALVMTAVLAACASKRMPTPDTEPTLKTLATREFKLPQDKGIEPNVQRAITAYRNFLDAAPKAEQRAEAMRRLGDLEMDSADERIASGAAAGTAADYKAAVTRYQDFLKAYPKAEGNDRVLYQLARAHELGGELELALATLDRLVAEHPDTRVRNEAQFRRGELLFTATQYAKAEAAYATVLKDKTNPYYERSLYMHGWSVFKQGRLEDALASFFGVLDRKVAGRAGDGDIDTIEGLSRADRELVEDTFRVASLSLANLQGAESVAGFINSDERRSYEFRIYQQLAELYLKQERVKDAADALGTFAKRNPMHPQAPVLQARVIEIYEQTGFAMLALEAKKDYVGHYGLHGEFRRINAPVWERAQPLVKTHLAELARHYHASAQKSKATADYQEAVRWYRAYLEAFPKDPEAPQNNFLLAELLFEDSRFAQAATEYEHTAYGYPLHAKSADAGYAALLSYAAQEKRTPEAERAALQRSSVASALRFAKANPKDTRTGPVLTNAAEKLFTLRDGAQAASVAQQVLALDPPASSANRRVAWTVLAHTAFDAGTFDQAERAYGEVLALVPESEASRNELVERLAASIYKQGEQARKDGKLREAVGHFTRVATAAPLSAVRATAQYDSAAALIALKDWDAATRTLEDFRQRYPKHPLQADVAGKLAVAYSEQGQWARAASEFERLATSPDPKVASAALWQAAELYEKSGSKAAAAKAYERYLRHSTQPLEPAIEARYRLAKLAKEAGDHKREQAWMKELQQVEQAGGNARTARTRHLGAMATLALTEPLLDDYRSVKLVEPLAKQLKLKKSKMETLLKVYTDTANSGVPEAATAATYHIAALYKDFGKSLIDSQRPKKLSKAELEQYNVMLEEQAYPFEEKAIEVHEINAGRAAQGFYDEWVKKSYAALRELRPVRYGKTERSEGVIDAIR
jgi:cellulose synthase operon protein C